jgi:uncharacterized protein (DUF1778 family)
MFTHSLTTDKSKLHRIDLRTTGKVKKLLMQAARIAGTSVSAFLIDAAHKKAERLLAEQETLKLSHSERDRFLEMLEGAGKPNITLKKAMRKYLTSH